MESDSNLRYIEYMTMVDNNLKAQKAFIKQVEKNPEILYARDSSYYNSLKKRNFNMFTSGTIVTFCFSLYWTNRLDLRIHQGYKVYSSIALILFLPFYSVKLCYGNKTSLPYEEYLYTKYVLFKAK